MNLEAEISLKAKLVRKAKILHKNESAPPPVNKEGLVVKVVGSNDGFNAPQINRDVEVKVASSSVASNGSAGGATTSKSVVNVVNESIQSVSTGFLGSTNDSNCSNLPHTHGVSAHDGDPVPASNAELDNKMQ